MFYKKLYIFIFLVLAFFNLYPKGPVSVGLEVSKYPVNYFFSKEFDKNYIDFIMSKIQADPVSLLKTISEGDQGQLSEYVDNNYTFFCASNFDKESISTFMNSLLIKFLGTGLILATQQFFSGEWKGKFCAKVNYDHDLFTDGGFFVETLIRVTNNSACVGYGIKMEGKSWIKRNLIRFCLLLIFNLGRFKFDKSCEWFSWLINRCFDLKDYESFCKGVLVKSIINSKEDFINKLQGFIRGNKDICNNDLLQVRSFIENAYKDIPITRRIIQMDTISKFILAVALKVFVYEWNWFRPVVREEAFAY